jgi:hypothetical protein
LLAAKEELIEALKIRLRIRMTRYKMAANISMARMLNGKVDVIYYCIVHIGCWVHARRKWIEALPSDTRV